jgi:glycosyl transferase family 25
MVFMPEHHRYLVAAEVACYLSHRLAIETLLAADADAGVIFEDDVALAGDFPVALQAAAALGAGERIIKFEGMYAAHRVHLHVASAGDRDIALMLKPTTGAAAYFVTRDAAARLHRCMLPIREPYDTYLRQYWRHGVDVLEVAPFPVRQLPFPTNIPQRRDQVLSPALPPASAAALALATPCLKLARLLRRTAALARRAHRLGRLRLRPRRTANRARED